MTLRYKAVTINPSTAGKIEKVLNEMADDGWHLHSQPVPLLEAKGATVAVVAIFEQGLQASAETPIVEA